MCDKKSIIGALYEQSVRKLNKLIYVVLLSMPTCRPDRLVLKTTSQFNDFPKCIRPINTYITTAIVIARKR